MHKLLLFLMAVLHRRNSRGIGILFLFQFSLICILIKVYSGPNQTPKMEFL